MKRKNDLSGRCRWRAGRKLALFALLLGLMMVLSGCGSGSSGSSTPAVETKTFRTGSDYYTLTVKVPKDGDYKFTKKVPDKFSGLYPDYPHYLVGGDVLIAFSGFFTDHSFASFRKTVLSDDYSGSLENVKETKVAGRDALRSDYRVGVSPAPLYGYRYTVDVDDINDTMDFELVLLSANGEKDTIDDLLKEDEVKSVVDSLKIRKAK